MRAIKFKQVTNNVAENQDQYQTLPAFYGQLGDNPKETGLVTCFELTDDELAKINKYGKIWHSQLTFGEAMQPIQMFVVNDLFNPGNDNAPVDGKKPRKRIEIDKLPEKFRGLKFGETPQTADDLFLSQNGKFIAKISYSKTYDVWDFFLDNFPGEKKFYRTNIPFYNYEQFRIDCDRMGIVLTYISDEEDE